MRILFLKLCNYGMPAQILILGIFWNFWRKRFRVRVVIRSLLIMLNTITMCLKNLIFFTITWRSTSMDKFILRNIVGCYQNKNSSQNFCKDNLISKSFKKLSLVKSAFIKTRVCSPDPRTSLNSNTDVFHESVL